MLVYFVWFLLISPILASNVSSGNEWKNFNLDDIHDMTIEFEQIQGLCYTFDSKCDTELEIDFEIELDAITSESLTVPSHRGNGNGKVAIIAACCTAALAASVILFILGKKALINYLQSGKYVLPEDNRGSAGFHELSQRKC